MTDPAGVIPRLRRDMKELERVSQEPLRQPDAFERTTALIDELVDLGDRITSLGIRFEYAAANCGFARDSEFIEGMQRHSLELGRLAFQAMELSGSLSRVVEHEAEARRREGK